MSRVGEFFRRQVKRFKFVRMGVVNARPGQFMTEYRPDFHYDLNRLPGYEPLFRAWVKHNYVNNVADMSRFYMLYLNAWHVLAEGVPGDVIELGVFRGNSARILAEAARQHGRHTWLFDTFSGFDPRDLKGVDRNRPLSFAETSIPLVRTIVGDEATTYVAGFFPDSLDQITMPAQIALAHIDVDLHAPMLAGLEHFYPRLAPGGMLILHDYSSGHWQGIRQAVDAFFADKPERPVLIPDKSGTAIVRRSYSVSV